MWDYYFGARGGFYEDINKTADKILKSGIYMSSEKKGFKSYTTSIKSLSLESALDKYGVECYYDSVVTDVFTEDEKICGIRMFNGEFVKIHARVVIDSAEGAVCRLLGLNNLGGRKYDNHTARCSRTVAIYEDNRIRGAWRQCEQLSGKAIEDISKIFYYHSSLPPCYAEKFNEKSRLYALGCIPGIREVFCCETDEVYTFSDYLDGKINEKVAFYSLSQLDNSCEDVWNEDDDYIDWRLLCNMKTYAFSVGITPEMLIVKGVENLLAAGKHIGTGHTLSSGVRMRTDMEKCGETAAEMAVLALKHECTVREGTKYYFDELHAVLEKSGCYNKNNDRGMCDLNAQQNGMWRSVELPQTVDELKKSLNSITPSLGLFAVRTHKIEINDTIVEWLNSDSKVLRENTAVALGLIADKRALPVLRDILNSDIEYHVHYWPETWLFSWFSYTELCNYTKAACLMSRLGEACDRELMTRLANYDGANDIRLMAGNYAKKHLNNNYRNKI